MASGEKVLKSTDLAYDNSLDIFEVPACNLGVSSVKYITHRPINQFSTEGNVKFRVPGTGSAYLDLREIYVKTVVRIVKGNGEPLPRRPVMARQAPGQLDPDTPVHAHEDEGEWGVGPVNGLANSLWYEAEVRMNDCVVLGGRTGYAYASMLNTLLDENSLTDGELECAMFIKDTAPYAHDMQLRGGGNDGYAERVERMKESQPVELLARLDADVFKVQKFLINGVTLDVNLTPTSSAFRLMSSNTTYTDFVLEIMDISLEVKQVVPTPQVLVAHQEILRTGLSRAKYFYLKEDIRRFALARGTSSYYSEDSYNGKIPSSLAITFVSGEGMNGRLSKNPYYFHHFDLTHLNVSVSGSPTPRGPLSFNFKEEKYLQSYSDLYGGKSKGPSNSQRITLKEFGKGYAIFVVNLNPQNRDTYFPTTRDGSVRIELKFARQLPESVIMLTRVCYPAMYSFDYERNVYLS